LWSRWFGLAVEAAVQRSVANDDVRNLAIAGSARVLVATWLSGSLFEPRDVETGIELHAVATRTWWSRDDRSDAFGLGAAIRMRGSSDADPPSLIAESRLFVRVMKSRSDVPDIAARSAGPVTMQPDRRGLAVIVGLGAAFGAGKQRYLERFRLRDRELLR
jgi:hypothetical protein